MAEAPSILNEPVFEVGQLFGDVNQPKQSIVTENVDQQYAFGTKLSYNDGRIFRYSQNGAVALAKARMTASAVQEAKIIAETQSTSGTSVEIGDVEITIDITTGITLAENALKDGTLVVESGTAIGDIYTILANKVDGSDDTLMKVLLRNPIRTAWSASTVISILKNRWKDVVVAPTSAAAPSTGVPLIAVTIAYFFWAQTGGPCAIIVDDSDTIVKGEPAGKPGTNADTGSVGLVANDGTDEVYGLVAYEAAADKAAIINLTLDR